MDPRDDGFEPPAACVQWCRARSYDLHVLDDGAPVDLDWWNARLDDAGHQIRLRARDLDGHVVTTGKAVLQRNDLRRHDDLLDGDNASLNLLFLCAAWRSGHTERRAQRRFPDVAHLPVTSSGDRFEKTTGVLDRCLRERRLPIIIGHSGTGWPDIPGVGVALLAAFLWAADASTSTGPAQLVDQHGVSTLLHEGWLGDPSVSDFTLRRYDRYVELLHDWAGAIGTRPELVEMWLVQRWNARVREARGGAPAQPTLF
ncbi:hypothetical protein [Speluncibacter jeojiensis]|uniref:Uncharacterized protein n=1 Tax=Speluncibacter jeojiensis TaxID=2710754 RepID=A0A9X4REI1_9ACTN|nr:hypothetical protein [Corynebacteriales bacterium D3-21]